MRSYFSGIRLWTITLTIIFSYNSGFSQTKNSFRVMAFFTGRNDQAHISFVSEANGWFPKMALKYGFSYDTTSNWNNLNDSFLLNYEVLIFLDTRPDSISQRMAFQRYMEKGGAWLGFHFSAFTLTPSAYPQDWDWYHEKFLGSGSYVSNTWRPTSAVLRVESKHPATRHLPKKFSSAPNEWYRWSNDLRKNPDISILLAIDSSSFPLGTGPKQHEIWHEGYYPVAWTNRKFKMIYLNMGHNDIDYEHNSDKELSYTFEKETQNQFIIDALLSLGKKQKKRNRWK